LLEKSFLCFSTYRKLQKRKLAFPGLSWKIPWNKVLHAQAVLLRASSTTTPQHRIHINCGNSLLNPMQHAGPSRALVWVIVHALLRGRTNTRTKARELVMVEVETKKDTLSLMLGPQLILIHPVRGLT
jgi:hypothetical protein